MPRWAPPAPRPDAAGVTDHSFNRLRGPTHEQAQPTVTRQRHRLPLAAAPGGRGLHRRRRPRLPARSSWPTASIPNIARFMREGFAAVADGSMPSFTCPNNMSIITGTPTAKHGISGNFYLDTATWRAGGDDRPGAAARRHHPRQVRRRRREGGVDHRQGQAAQAARQGPGRRARATCRFSSEFAERARWPRTASRTCSSSSACRSPACTRWSCRCSCSRPASSC